MYSQVEIDDPTAHSGVVVDVAARADAVIAIRNCDEATRAEIAANDQHGWQSLISAYPSKVFGHMRLALGQDRERTGA